MAVSDGASVSEVAAEARRSVYALPVSLRRVGGPGGAGALRIVHELMRRPTAPEFENRQRNQCQSRPPVAVHANGGSRSRPLSSINEAGLSASALYASAAAGR